MNESFLVLFSKKNFFCFDNGTFKSWVWFTPLAVFRFPGADGGADVGGERAVGCGRLGVLRFGAGFARGGRARGKAQPFRRGDAEGAAERAEDSSGLGGGFDEGADVGVGEDDLDVADVLGGGLDQADQPEMGFGDGDRLGAVGVRAGGCGAGLGGAGLGQGSGLPALGETVEAQGHASEAVVDQGQQGFEVPGAGDVIGHGGAQPGEGGGHSLAERGGDLNRIHVMNNS